MHRITRLILRPILFVLLPLFLVACGSDEDSNNGSAVYGSHSVVLVQSSTKSFGANGYGQLGNGATADSSIPVNVPGTFSAVSIGGAHSIGLKADGTVWAWGNNASGQLGNGTQDSKTSPVLVTTPDGVSGFTAVAAGGNHSLAIDNLGNLWAWGLNTSGQLGDGTTDIKTTPFKITTLGNVVAIAAGGTFSIALKGDGTVWYWGTVSDKRLANSILVSSSTPVLVTIDTNDVPIEKIAAGGSHALALDVNGVVYAWGYNELGQLGDGTTTSSSIAVRLDMPGTVTAISAGLDHSLAVIGGGVYAWGYNYYGQLGNGDPLKSNTPVTELQRVTDQNGVLLSSIVDIVAVGHHSIARDISSTVWTWGNNTYGQLGDGTTQSRSRAKALVN